MAVLPAAAGHGGHQGVSPCSVRLGRDWGRSSGSDQPGLPKDMPPVQGCPPLPQAWPFPRSWGASHGGHLWGAGRPSRGHPAWAHEHPCDTVPGLPLPFGLWVSPATGWVSVQAGAGAGGSGHAARWQQSRSGLGRMVKAKVWGITNTYKWFWLWLPWGEPAGEVRTGCRASPGSPGSGAVLHLRWLPSEHSHHTLGEGPGIKIRAGLA